MKDIRVLDLSHCELGDSGVCEIVQELDSCSVNLEELNLSGNGIGKNFTYFNRYLEQLLHFLDSSSRLSVLKLSHNNLRGNSVKEIKKKDAEQPVPWRRPAQRWRCRAGSWQADGPASSSEWNCPAPYGAVFPLREKRVGCSGVSRWTHPGIQSSLLTSLAAAAASSPVSWQASSR